MRDKLLAWSYCLIFLNPLSLANEVWPYYIIFCFTYSYKAHNIFLIIGYAITVSVGLFFNDGILLLDVFQALLVMQTCIYLSTLRESQKDKICQVFERFILISLVVGIAQFSIDRVQEHTYFFFSGRESFADGLLIDRNVVSLLAPEPAYAAAHLLSIFLFLMYCRRFSWLIPFTFVVLMLMTRAVSVWLILPSVIAFAVATNRLPMKYLLVGLFSMIILLIYFWENLEKLFSRLLIFVEYVVAYGSILSAEAELGSVRIGQIVSTSFTFFNDEYVKPFSFLGAINITTYSFAVLLLMVPICFLMVKAPLVTIMGLTILLLTGPALLAFTVASVLLMTLEHVKSKQALIRKNNEDSTFSARLSKPKMLEN